MLFGKALILWITICFCEVVHGILRMRFLAPRVGKARSDQIGVFSGSLIILVIVWLCFPWLGADQTSEQLMIGFGWAFGMIGFEMALGRLYMRLPWEKITEAYDPRRGGRMLIGMSFLALSPWLTAWLR